MPCDSPDARLDLDETEREVTDALGVLPEGEWVIEDDGPDRGWMLVAEDSQPPGCYPDTVVARASDWDCLQAFMTLRRVASALVSAARDRDRLADAVHELEEMVSETEGERNRFLCERDRLAARVRELEAILGEVAAKDTEAIDGLRGVGVDVPADAIEFCGKVRAALSPETKGGEADG